MAQPAILPPTRILPGAFAETLNDKAQRRRVRILLHHDSTRPIGLPVELRETKEGLFVRARLSESRAGREARELLREIVPGRRLIEDLSIGFDPVKWSMVDENELGRVRHIESLRLWEISLVTWGADDRAKVKEAASRERPSEVLGILELLENVEDQELILDYVMKED